MPHSSAEAMSAWRLTSRQASEELNARNYQAAELGYEKAIDELKRENSKADEIYSLQLLLVETYRRSGKVHKAREILNKMEPAIKSEKYVDPTIAVRFWRRMSEVESSFGSKKTSLVYSRKAVSVLEKYFDRTSSTLQKNYISLLQLACEEFDYDTITETLSKLTEEGAKQNVMANATISSAFSKLVGRSLAIAEQGNYKEAYRQLKTIKAPDFRVSNRTEMWIQFAQFCLSHSKQDEAMATVPTLFQLLEDAKKLPKEESIPLSMKLHMVIATIYSKGSEKEKAQCVSQFRKALAISNESKVPRPIEIRALRVLAIEGITTAPIIMSSTPATDEAIKLLQEPIEFSIIPPREKLAEGELRGVQDAHISARVCLALAYLSRRQTLELDKTLASVDRNLLKNYPPAASNLAIANFYIDLAKLYFAQNKKADGDRALVEAKKLTIDLSPSPELNAFLEKYRSLENELKTASDKNKGTVNK